MLQFKIYSMLYDTRTPSGAKDKSLLGVQRIGTLLYRKYSHLKTEIISPESFYSVHENTSLLLTPR